MEVPNQTPPYSARVRWRLGVNNRRQEDTTIKTFFRGFELRLPRREGPPLLSLKAEVRLEVDAEAIGRKITDKIHGAGKPAIEPS